MSEDFDPRMVPAERVPSFPEGANSHGLFEIMSFGICKKDHSMDCALNRQALDDLPPLRRAELADLMEIILKDVRQ